MIKRLVALLLILILPAGTALAGEQHLRFVLSVGPAENRTEAAADLVFRDDETLILSDLFPSYVLSLPASGGMKLRLPSFSADDFEILPREIVSVCGTEEIPGLYSGDLFDLAVTMQTGSIRTDRLIPVLLRLFGAVWETVLQSQPDPAGGLETLFAQPGLSGLQLRYSAFDGGRFYSFTGCTDDATLFTASFDFSDPEKVRAILGNAENGVNYYRVLDASIPSEDNLQVRLSLISDPLKAGYRSALQNRPVLSAGWAFSIDRSLGMLSFSGEMIPENGLEPLFVKGNLTEGDPLSFEAELRFGEKEGSALSLSLKPDGSSVSEAGRQKITLQDLNDPEAANSLFMESGASVLSLYFAFLQILPDGYLGFFPNLLN